MSRRVLVFLALLAATSAEIRSALSKVELSEEKTPFDYVNERLDSIGTDARNGLPLSNTYEVEESEDYPEQIEGAASTILNTGVGVGGLGLGQGIGFGGLGGLGQGLGIGYGGVGGAGLGQVGGVGGVGIGGVGVGGIANGGIGLINQGIGGIGVGGLGGLGGGLLYHPLLGAQVGGGYLDKKAYDAAQKKGADENIEKLEKKAEEEIKHDQQGYQQAAAVAKGEKGDSSFYKDEEAKKKAAGDEKFYEGGQKFDKHGK